MGKTVSTKAVATALLTALLLGPSAVQGFLSPAIWSRINSHLRLYGQQGQPQQQPAAQAAFLPLVGGRRSFADRMTALRATAPMSFGDFGAGDEALNFAEMREQLGALESQLAGAMELGTCAPRRPPDRAAGQSCVYGWMELEGMRPGR